MVDPKRTIIEFLWVKREDVAFSGEIANLLWLVSNVVINKSDFPQRLGQGLLVPFPFQERLGPLGLAGPLFILAVLVS